MHGFILSHQQARIWLLQRNSRTFYVQCAILIEGSLDAESLRNALQDIVNGNEAFRTTFHRRPGMKLPIQVVSEVGDLSWQIVDLRRCDEGEHEARVEQWLEQERCLPLDFEKGPVLRAALLAFSDQSHILSITLPALCADDQSMKNIFQELSRRYGGAGETAEELTQYVQYSEWQRELLSGEDGESGRAYWISQGLPDPSAISIPSQMDEAIGETFDPAAFSQLIPGDALSNIEAVCDQYDSTLPIFLQACWRALIWRLTGRSEFVIGAEFSGREYEELEGAMGAFARWVPIHLRFDETFKFKHALAQTENALLETREWQEYFSREYMLDANGEQADFAIGFEYHEIPSGLCAGNISFSLIRLHSCIDRFKLKLRLLAYPDYLQAQFHFDSSLFSLSDIQLLADRFSSLLRSASSNPHCLVSDLDILGASERSLLLSDFNSSSSPFDRSLCLHQLFEAQAARSTHSTAAICEDQTISYFDLNRRANQLARYLRRKGIGPDSVVGVCLERSVEMVVGLLGILKAGGAYLPLDLSYPTSRLSYMVADSRVKVVLTGGEGAREWLEGVEEVRLDRDWDAISEECEENFDSGADSQNLAYVIYTSGSTGRPKGVMISHQGLSNYLNWCAEAYQAAAGSGSIVHTPIGFDLTVTSLFPPLIVGQRLALLAEDKGVEGLSRMLLGGDDFSLIKITPAHLYILNELLPEGQISGRVRSLVIGGDSLHSDSLAPWYANSPDTRLINEYGPTETVVGCCVYEVSGRKPVKGAIPIGRPIANTQIYILDTRLRLAPIGTAGEIFIGGEGVARGYFDKPDLTAETFLPDPFSGKPGARLYRTGDLGRYLQDGNLVFIGRIDNQVKIRGYRIELGEIEAVLTEQPSVGEAVVVVQDKPSSDKTLKAFVVVKPGHTLKADALRSFLKEKLADYMMPSRFVFLDSLPLTENGKTDRRALAGMDILQEELSTAYVAPRTEIEEIIASLWQDLLKVGKVGVNDNFFDIGGHSLLMVQVHSRLQALLERDISLIEMFGHPTIFMLAEYLTEENGEPAFPAAQSGRADYRRASIRRQRQLRDSHRRPEQWEEIQQ